MLRSLYVPKNGSMGSNSCIRRDVRDKTVAHQNSRSQIVLRAGAKSLRESEVHKYIFVSARLSDGRLVGHHRNTSALPLRGGLLLLTSKENILATRLQFTVALLL